MQQPEKKHLTVVIEYEPGAALPNELLQAFATDMPFHGARITAASHEDKLSLIEERELELELENGPDIVQRETDLQIDQQQIADFLFEFGAVTHNDLNDTQSGCVQLNRLDELVDAIENCFDEIQRQNKR